MSRVRTLVLAALTLAPLAGGAVPAARADLWSLPSQRTYYSESKRFGFEVTPKPLGSQSERPADEERHCRGVFLEQSGDTYARRAAFRLENHLAPMNALVADSGRHVVTFDNWGRLGYGDEVIVIYLSDGTLVRKLALTDFLTEPDIRALSHTASSIWWGGALRLDEEAGHVVVRVVASRRVRPGETAEDAEKRHHDLRIVLETGEPSEAKRDLFPEFHWRLEPVPAEIPPDRDEE